ncbi:MAG TPA: hypothetical protein VLW50_07200, partial [Streptosporangiaceae bacterium]|nr:hypothetical protein [Streptosporangiaceae bacterium]
SLCSAQAGITPRSRSGSNGTPPDLIRGRGRRASNTDGAILLTDRDALASMRSAAGFGACWTAVAY